MPIHGVTTQRKGIETNLLRQTITEGVGQVAGFDSHRFITRQIGDRVVILHNHHPGRPLFFVK